MKKKEREEYLERWGNECFICKALVEDDERTLVESIVPLSRCPEHADPEYFHTYMVCPICLESKELV